MWDFIATNWDKISVIFFAALSAAFAGLSFLVIWLEYRRNNPRVEMHVSNANIFDEHSSLKVLWVKYTNQGRRPVVIANLYFINTDRTVGVILQDHPMYLPTSAQLPKKIQEGETINIHLDYQFLLQEFNDNQKKPEYVCSEDTFGNKHKTKLKHDHLPDIINKSFFAW